MQEKNVNIEKARIFAMLSILIGHNLGHGGILETCNLFSLNYEVGYFIKSLIICGVNVYAIISGYVLYGKHIKVSNIVRIWLEVWFYSCLMSFGSSIIFHQTITKKQLITTLMPVLTKQYWYPTVYIGLYFFVPYLNSMIDVMDKKYIRRMLYLCFILCSCLPTIVNNNLMDVPTGSITWLAICYLIGAFIRKYGINELIFYQKTISCSKWLGLYIMSGGVIWLSHYVLSHLTLIVFGEIRYASIFITNISPLVLIEAICLFQFSLVQKQTGKFKRVIMMFGGNSLVAYLIQDNIYFKKNWFENLLIKVSGYNVFMFVIITIGVAILFYIVAVGCEYIRKGLLNNKLYKNITDKMDEKFGQWVIYK